MSASPHTSTALVNKFDVGFTGSSGLVRASRAFHAASASHERDRFEAQPVTGGFGLKRRSSTEVTGAHREGVLTCGARYPIPFGPGHRPCVVHLLVSACSPPSAPRPSRHRRRSPPALRLRSEEHTSELQSRLHLVCRLLLEK